GEPDLADGGSELLDKLGWLEGVKFTIEVDPPDFGEIARAHKKPRPVPKPETQPRAEPEAVPVPIGDLLDETRHDGPIEGDAPHRPAGKLSAISEGDRLFHIQTEVVAEPEPQVVTVVVSDGATLFKRKTPLPLHAGPEVINVLLKAQHE